MAPDDTSSQHDALTPRGPPAVCQGAFAKVLIGHDHQVGGLEGRGQDGVASYPGLFPGTVLASARLGFEEEAVVVGLGLAAFASLAVALVAARAPPTGSPQLGRSSTRPAQPKHGALTTRIVDGDRVERASPDAVSSTPPSWATLGRRARTWRLVHASWSVVQLGCLTHLWVSAVRRRRGRLVGASAAFLLAEGAGLVAGRGNCPMGPLQETWGDPVPFFELVLPPRAAKAAVPVLAMIAIAGLIALAVRPPRPGAISGRTDVQALAIE
jgi:hypothetical protein